MSFVVDLTIILLLLHIYTRTKNMTCMDECCNALTGYFEGFVKLYDDTS